MLLSREDFVIYFELLLIESDASGCEALIRNYQKLGEQSAYRSQPAHHGHDGGYSFTT